MNNTNIPNILTMFRIVLIPIIIASFYLERDLFHIVAAGLFIVASITDFFDGYLARVLKATSSFGTFLDPIADKLLVASILLMLVNFDYINNYDILPAIAILCREILVSGLREHLGQLSISMPVTKLSKFKTATQMIALFLLLLGVEGPSIVEVEQLTDENTTVLFGRVLLWISAILTTITGYVYLKAGIKHMK